MGRTFDRTNDAGVHDEDCSMGYNAAWLVIVALALRSVRVCVCLLPGTEGQGGWECSQPHLRVTYGCIHRRELPFASNVRMLSLLGEGCG